MYQRLSVYAPRQNRRKSLRHNTLRQVYWQIPYHIGAQQISCHSLEKKNIFIWHRNIFRKIQRFLLQVSINTV